MDEKALTHLLQMYPASALREIWATKKGIKKDELIASVVGSIPERGIVEFCRIHQPLTKQRIIVFDNQADDLSAFPDPLLDIDTRTYFSRSPQQINEFYILTVTYTALVGDSTFTEETFDFLWPVSLAITSKHAIVTFTIIEKTLAPYLPEGQTAVNVRKAFGEDDVCSLLLRRLPAATLTSCDLHKGIKTLWRDDVVDASFLCWKGDKSTDTKTMDTKCLIKRDKPETYAEAIKAPLLKSVFTTVSDDEFPPLFTIAPLDGEVSIHRHSDTLTEVENVVSAILRAN